MAVLPAPLPFVAIPPCRQYDSRNDSPLPNNTPRTVVLTGAPCGIPVNALAVSVNITVFSIVGATGNGVFKVDTVSPPVVAWINYPPTETQRGNAGTVPLTSGGAIVVLVSQGGGSVNFVVDVNGYYSPLGVVNSVTAGTGLAGGGTGAVIVGIAPGGVSATELGSNAVTAGAIAPNAAVKSLNAETGDLTIAGSGGITVGAASGTITVSGSGGGAVTSGSALLGKPGDTTLIAAGYTEAIPNFVDGWTATAMTGAPSFRALHTAVWTGTKMIVWEGDGNGGSFNDGGRFLPGIVDSWGLITTFNAPSARGSHAAVWTGSEMIIWGGGFFSNVGARWRSYSLYVKN